MSALPLPGAIGPQSALMAAASIAGKPSSARSDATGGYQLAPLGNSHWTVNIAGDGLVGSSPASWLPLLVLGGALFLGARWISRKA